MWLLNYNLTLFVIVIFAISVNGNKINCDDNLSDDAISQKLKVEQIQSDVCIVFMKL